MAWIDITRSNIQGLRRAAEAVLRDLERELRVHLRSVHDPAHDLGGQSHDPHLLPEADRMRVTFSTRPFSTHWFPFAADFQLYYKKFPRPSPAAAGRGPPTGKPRQPPITQKARNRRPGLARLLQRAGGRGPRQKARQLLGGADGQRPGQKARQLLGDPPRGGGEGPAKSGPTFPDTPPRAGGFRFLRFSRLASLSSFSSRAAGRRPRRQKFCPRGDRPKKMPHPGSFCLIYLIRLILYFLGKREKEEKKKNSGRGGVPLFPARRGGHPLFRFAFFFSNTRSASLARPLFRFSFAR